MEKEYYQTGLKPILIKKFKQICDSQNLRDNSLKSLVNKHNDPYQLLEYLRASKHVMSSYQKEMIEDMPNAIQEIADGTKYYTAGGSTTLTVINKFAKLIKSIGGNGERSGANEVQMSYEGAAVGRGERGLKDVSGQNDAVDEGVGGELNKEEHQSRVKTTGENSGAVPKSVAETMTMTNQKNLVSKKMSSQDSILEGEEVRVSKQTDWILIGGADEDGFVMV